MYTDITFHSAWWSCSHRGCPGSLFRSCGSCAPVLHGETQSCQTPVHCSDREPPGNPTHQKSRSAGGCEHGSPCQSVSARGWSPERGGARAGWYPWTRSLGASVTPPDRRRGVPQMTNTYKEEGMNIPRWLPFLSTGTLTYPVRDWMSTKSLWLWWGVKRMQVEPSKERRPWRMVSRSLLAGQWKQQKNGHPSCCFYSSQLLTAARQQLCCVTEHRRWRSIFDQPVFNGNPFFKVKFFAQRPPVLLCCASLPGWSALPGAPRFSKITPIIDAEVAKRDTFSFRSVKLLL